MILGGESPKGHRAGFRGEKTWPPFYITLHSPRTSSTTKVPNLARGNLCTPPHLYWTPIFLRALSDERRCGSPQRRAGEFCATACPGVRPRAGGGS